MSLSALEAELDSFFSMVKIPSDSLYLSRWYCLTVSEDNIRNLLDKEELSPQFLGYLIDQTKYALKHMLIRLNEDCKELNPIRLPREVVPAFYIATSRLYFAGLDYARAHRLVASVHSGSASVENVGDGDYKISFSEIYSASPYAALELLAVQRQEGPGFITIMLRWLRGIDPIPLVIDAIAASVTKSKGLLHYKYDANLAFELAQILPQQNHVIPEDWMFEWGDRHSTSLLINSVSVRLLYHFIAIHFGSKKLNHRGKGHENLVLVIKLTSLIRDIKILSSLDDGIIKIFVDTLTYGSGTKSPDPALQPFIPAGNNFFLIASNFWLSGHLERNLLSLQARRDSASFDSQSILFEREMLSRLDEKKNCILKKSMKDVTIRCGKSSEQIDLLLWDDETQIVLICEMRAMLQPGDPREVLNRKNEVRRKVSQVQRKVQWAEKNIQSLENAIGIEFTPECVIRGLVTIDGYGGAASNNPRINVIPFNLFLDAICHTPTLLDLLEWTDQLAWQPEEHQDYRLIETEQMLSDGPKIKSQGIELLISQDEFFSRALEVLRYGR
ncbi:hypothetical protein [Xanthomonas arboricola]|uniref:hypothetical protein n=1 Tax=Xanthomonas arboricola TaxID=56448 RepID=UPI00141B47AA|nr:hypothetical protein [Xanthomonas arboricola]NIK44293.1 hypothetical protein [Xanthomonas arboricola]